MPNEYLASEWSCPRDGTQMVKSTDRSLLVSACRECSGLWVPKAQIVGKVDGDAIRKLYHAPSTRLTELRCPVDGSPLWEFSADGVRVDRCNQCGGLWFDAGELAAVMSKVRFTTSPAAAMAVKKPGAEEEYCLWKNLLNPPRSGPEVALEVVFEIVKCVASAVAD